tara:strand:- start:95 stop:628 length:534 start_codon:yes stop_codon:yes gene_type:complete
MKADLDKLKESYLRYLKIYLELQNPDGGLIRTFLDNWFAYKMKGNFLTKNNKPRWFNGLNTNKLSDTHKDCLLKMNFISKDAFEAINNKSNTRLMKDHSVPIKIIRMLLQSDLSRSEKNIEKFLNKYYRLGVLTKEEDIRLNDIKLKSDMPQDWDGYDVFARYKKAGIERAKPAKTF